VRSDSLGTSSQTRRQGELLKCRRGRPEPVDAPVHGLPLAISQLSLDLGPSETQSQRLISMNQSVLGPEYCRQ
jgi:hypothetical protein